ncbi:MAG: hypothetical protein KDJ88_07535 [Bauldia sp.]|nr:hypothetical protein [Bauldia sp.]
MITGEHLKTRLASLSVLVLLSFGLAGTPARACYICIALPEDTFADQILRSEAVILAREDPARPFTFRSVAILKGSLPPDPIPFLVDSATRRRLANAPDDAVLLVWGRPDRKRMGPFSTVRPEVEWQRLAYADPEVRAMTADVLARLDAWQADKSGLSRFNFFAGLHADRNSTIRHIALSELARAPYHYIKRLKTELTRAEIMAALADMTMAPWAPTYILLLGRSDDPGCRDIVRAAISRASRRGSGGNLAAWATALVEIDGPAAVGKLSEAYFRDPMRSIDELKSVVAALGIQGSDGDPALRPGIARAFHDLARLRPHMAPYVAKYLTDWNDWSQVDAFASVLDSPLIDAPAERLVLSVYVRIGGENRRSETSLASP